MKRIYFYAFTFLIISCREKEPVTIKEIVSNEVVAITFNAKKTFAKDSVSIIIPIELEINLHENSLIFFDIDFFMNKKYMMIVDDYEIYDTQNKTKSLSSFKPYLSIKKPFKIIIKERSHLISLFDAKKIQKKYNINQSIDNLKFGDTIQLVPYSQFRKDNPEILNELRRIEDKIRITTSGKGEDFFYSQDFKINW